MGVMLHEGRSWNRDAAHHAWLAAVAAEHAGDVLDVGCGDGMLVARLAEVSRSVVGIDRDPAAVAQARKLLRFVPGAAVETAEFGSEWGLEPGSYDVITMVSVLHELPLRSSLERARELLKPGGSLLVVARTTPSTWLDRAHAWGGVGVGWLAQSLHTRLGSYRPEFAAGRGAANRHAGRGRRLTPADELRASVAELLPGAELRRGRYGRMLLRWARPVAVLPAAEPLLASTGDRVATSER